MTALDRARALIAETEGMTEGPWYCTARPNGGALIRHSGAEWTVADVAAVTHVTDLRAALAAMVAENERLREALADAAGELFAAVSDLRSYWGEVPRVAEAAAAFDRARAALTGDAAHE